MKRFLEEPSNQHGLAFVRSDNKAVLASGTNVEGHQAGDQDLAHVGGHLGIDNEWSIQEDLDMDEEVGTDNEKMKERI
jgi:hypothetical protein